MLQYLIRTKCLSHEWQVCLTLHCKDNIPLQIKLPNWVPGSYLIRDFSRHIVDIQATCNDVPKALKQISKNCWETPPEGGEWQIYYTVYAYDLSVRGAFLTSERGFFDGACLFLSVDGFEAQPHKVILDELPNGWVVATTMPQTASNRFQAVSYAELIDHPFELGRIETLTFEAGGIPHRIALSGHYQSFNRERLVQDIQKICSSQLEMFSGDAPFKEYLFLLHVGDDIYGGLEHISSTALLADRNSLPSEKMGDEADDAYIQLLGLFSHEYFHAWNVKSIKPEVFVPYQLDSESYTEQLWAFEGITSYYDDLFLVRSGVIRPQQYLKLLAKGITRVQQGFGRLKQTLAESSFTAWNKFYKQDENSTNAIVSYYQKGALVALCLDLLLRSRSDGKTSLDDVMRALYRKWCENGQGIPEGQWQVYCREITGLDLDDFFQTALYSRKDLPLVQCLFDAGVALNWLPLPRSHGGGFVMEAAKCEQATDFGAKFKQVEDGIVLTHVLSGGSAEQAALSPKDKIIALNGFACKAFEKQWQSLSVGDIVHIHYFRDGVLHETDLTVQKAKLETAMLSIENQSLLKAWLQAS